MKGLLGFLYYSWHAFRLLWDGRDAMLYFDRSLRGFWISFTPAIILLPLQLYMVMANSQDVALDVPNSIFLTVQTLSYTINWLAYPLVVFHLLNMMDRSRQFFDYMVPYNWSHVSQTLLYSLLLFLQQSSLLPDPVLQALSFMLSLGIFFYLWRIARVTLSIDAFGATGLVLLDIIVGAFVMMMAASILVH